MFLLPQPSSLCMGEGSFLIQYQSRIFLTSSSDALLDDALLLQKEIEADTGMCLSLCQRQNPTEDGRISLSVVPDVPAESYELSIRPKRIEIRGSRKNGVLYGVQTLRQIIRQCGACLPVLEIKDAPALPNRGFYHDVTRGRIPTLSFLKKLADELSFYKINQMQLYIEHTYLFDDLTEMWRDDTPLTSEDILELDRYCKKLGIELVPSLASFGHLYKLLSTKSYASLCELPDSDTAPFSFHERQLHHTLDITKPDSLSLAKKMIWEYMQLFSSRQFNLCADETFDLGKGASRALAEEKGTTVIYTEFLTSLAEFVTECGRTPMFWSDIISKEPEVYHVLPENLICLHWDYAPDVSSERLQSLIRAGASKLYLCPGVQGWNQLINKYHDAYENITKMCCYAHESHALGVLNTDWGDFGHINHPEFSRIGMIYGAAFSWNPNILPEEEINRQISVLAFGDASGTLVSILRDLSGQDAYPWHSAVMVQEGIELKKEGQAEHYLSELASSDPDAAKERIDTLTQALYQKIGSVPSESKKLLRAYLVAADGIRLLNRLLPVMRSSVLGSGTLPEKKDRFALASDLERWYYHYKALWRTVSRESERYRIDHVIFWYADYLREL